MHVVRACVLLVGPLLSGCAAVPSPPPGAGRGLIAFDAEPPPGAVVWPRPTPQVGDTFVVRRGGRSVQRFAVVAAGPGGSTLADDRGQRVVRDADLGHLGEWPPQGDRALHLLSPGDTRYHWPLWVGKRWRCEFVDRAANGQEVRVGAAYVVEGLDTVDVPAGTFQALRIVRRASREDAGERYFERTTLCWYAPAIGLDVRQVVDSTAFELVEWTRGPSR